MNIELDWKSYEELVRYIYETLGKASNVKILGHGNQCKIRGKSGVEHQIDVLTSHNDGMHDYLTDIECKFWDQKINKDIVMKVNEIVEDCNFSKGIIVSKCGFTDDAIKFAEYKGIGLVELRKMTEADWEGRLRSICFTIDFKCPQITSVKVDTKNIDPNGEKKQLHLISDGSQILIHHTSQNDETLSDFIERDFIKELNKRTDNKEFHKTYQFEEGTTITLVTEKTTYALISITLSGILDIYTEKMIIDGNNEILYIMKLIFEKKEMTIRKDGQIIMDDKK